MTGEHGLDIATNDMWVVLDTNNGGYNSKKVSFVSFECRRMEEDGGKNWLCDCDESKWMGRDWKPKRDDARGSNDTTMMIP